ncbi:hypothetical protein [Pedobacter jeongneungensis]|uniref:hypothetical protein n=1 Tax=Pedobacter jeongneungensis TaxID=947309 RepID=UPI0004681E04|nr:hypothetical protein [Pedobacter jeongneungensis]
MKKIIALMLKTSMLMCLILSLYSCKKGADGSNNALNEKEVLQLVGSAKKLYEMKVTDAPTSRFTVDWSNYVFEGDSILVVKTKGVSIASAGRNKDSDVAMVSGVIFKLRDKQIIRVQKVDFFGKQSVVKDKGLKILASFNKLKSGKSDIADGIFLQYSAKHNMNVAGFSIKNGKIESNRYIAVRRILSLNNSIGSKTNARVSNFSNKLMNGYGTSNCEPVYLYIYDKQTGRIISQTWLYDACEDQTDPEATNPNPPSEPDVDPCENDKAVDALSYELAGDNNLIVLDNEAAGGTTRSMIYRWVFLRNSLHLWSYESTERGFHKKVGEEWQWDRLEHLGEGLSGITPATEITVSNFVLQPTIGKYYATAKAYFNFKAKLLCESKLNPIPGTNQNLSATCEVWYVNDIFE